MEKLFFTVKIKLGSNLVGFDRSKFCRVNRSSGVTYLYFIFVKYLELEAKFVGLLVQELHAFLLKGMPLLVAKFRNPSY